MHAKLPYSYALPLYFLSAGLADVPLLSVVIYLQLILGNTIETNTAHDQTIRANYTLMILATAKTNCHYLSSVASTILPITQRMARTISTKMVICHRTNATAPMAMCLGFITFPPCSRTALAA